MEKRYIKFNEDVEFEVEVTLRNMFGEIIELEYSLEHSTKKKAIYSYECEQYSVYAGLEVCTFDDYSYIDVDVSITSRSGYDMRYMLNGYNTFAIDFTPCFKTKQIFGSYYYEGVKCDCWARHFHANSFEQLKDRMASLVWNYNDTYYHILPLCDSHYKSELKGCNSCLTLTTAPYCGGFSNVKCKAAVVSWGKNPFETARNTVRKGFEVLNLRNAMTENTRISDVFNYLGWCSWDSMGVNVTSSGIYKKLDEFKEKNIPVSWVLLDDGWYPENEKRQILSFTEKTDSFPEGLKKYVNILKENYHIKYAGIWECFSGGWRGIAPNSDVARDRKDIVEVLPNNIIFPRVDEQGSFAYWNFRHDYLSRCGFDFVKIDVECNIETCTHSIKAIGDAARGAHYGMEGSVGLYFDGACINCTGMGQESLWNRPIGMVNRNSADFLPNNVKSMNQFINDNIYNSYYHSYFSATDWDMMWSGGSETVKMNTVLHALSGGPIYLSDPIGVTDASIVMPFCLNDGEILKCDSYAQPTEDRLFVDPQTHNVATKAWNVINNCGVVGVFNTNDNEVTISDTFSASDVNGITGVSFLIYDWFGKSYKICTYDEKNDFTLQPYDAKLYLIVPFKNGLYVLGNIDKYIAPATIEYQHSDDNINTYVLKNGGKFSFYTDRKFVVKLFGNKVEPSRTNGLYVVDCTKIKNKAIIQIEFID